MEEAKAWDTGDENEGEDNKYVSMASDFQVPCFLINSKGTPLWKAQEAPALRKAWNVSGGVKAKASDMVFRCFLATESVRGVGPLLRGKMNNGSLGEAGMAWIMAARADMGHRWEEPRKGRGRVTVSLRF